MSIVVPFLHVLLCEKHLGFGVPCLQSVLRHSADPWQLVIHDDGSLTEESLERLPSELPGSRIVTRRQADELFADHLSKYPAMAEARTRLPHVIKLLDINLYPDSEKVTRYVDSDVFFFKGFRNLFPNDGSEPAGAGVFSLDSNSSFGAKASDFWPLGPLVLVRKLNSGVFWFRRRSLDFERMEWLFRRWGPARIDRYGGWFEQAVWADQAHRAGVRMYDSAQLSTATSEEPNVGPKVGMHYVTPARARLLKLLQAPATTAKAGGAPVEIRSVPAHRYGLAAALAAAVRFRMQR